MWLWQDDLITAVQNPSRQLQQEAPLITEMGNATYGKIQQEQEELIITTVNPHKVMLLLPA